MSLLTDEEFNRLDDKVKKEIDRLRKKITELESENMTLSMKKLDIRSNVLFMGVGMQYITKHTFSEHDNISLEKEDDNSKDSNAIKIMVNNKHVAYVSRDYTHVLRSIDGFERKKIRWVRNFRQSAKFELLF
ncbi:hypothetical protein G6F27_013653 [Rhizopus arrhizus]|nr:hypothetical protein G6F27_013653 [Rhizopus arrhizus]